MSDTVDTLTLISGSKRIVRRFTNVSDGTGESAVVKFDKSTFTGGTGSAPTKLNIEWVQWNIQGFSSVRLLWDATTDDEALVLSGNGYKDFREVGLLVDPASTGTTGDIMFTTAGAVSGATYDIVISVIQSN